MITFESSKIRSITTELVVSTPTGTYEKIKVLAAVWRLGDGSYITTPRAPSPDATLEVILAERKTGSAIEEPPAKESRTETEGACCAFDRFFLTVTDGRVGSSESEFLWNMAIAAFLEKCAKEECGCDVWTRSCWKSRFVFWFVLSFQLFSFRCTVDISALIVFLGVNKE
jgi:hypothetical protein